jgi:hypothetical protein
LIYPEVGYAVKWIILALFSNLVFNKGSIQEVAKICSHVNCGQQWGWGVRGGGR